MSERPSPELPSSLRKQKMYALTDQEKKYLEDFGGRVSLKDASEIKRIAQVIGGDLGLRVRIGKPGSGSYFDHQKIEITLDARRLAENLSDARYLAAHEGGHRRLSRGPETIGVKEELIQELFEEKVGFSYIGNVLEDPTVNNWVIKKFEGLRPDFKNTYDQVLAKEHQPLGIDHPDVKRALAITGTVPDFVRVGSELIRYWHTKRFSKDIKKERPEVTKVLGKVLRYARRYFKILPEHVFNEKDVREKARARFKLNYEKIWPHVEKLAEQDRLQEAIRQMAEEQMRSSPEKGLEQTLEDLRKGKTGSSLDQLDEQLRQELAEAIAKGQQQSKEQLDKLSQGLEEQFKEASGERAAQLKQEISATEQLQKELEQGQLMPLALNELSQELQEALQELYDRLPQEQKDKLAKAAKKQLQKTEDAFNETLEPKLNPDNPPSHQKFAEQNRREKSEAQKKLKRVKQIRELKQQARELSEQAKTDYDKVREEVDPEIEDLYHRLEDFFVRERHPKWRKGYAAGPRITLFKAMQYASGAKPEAYREMFERKTLPKRFDYKFSMVVDVSQSMDEGDKIAETRKGLVILAEVLNRLGIDHEIIIYNSEIGNHPLKNFDQDLDEARENIANLINAPAGYTPTAAALKESYRHIQEHASRENYIVVLTDGKPKPEGLQPTQHLVGQILRESELPVKIIGVGLGSDTGMVTKLFPSAIGNVPAKRLPETLGTLLEDMIINPEKYEVGPEARERFMG